MPHKMIRQTKICEYCKVVFERRPGTSKSNWDVKKYCSRLCKDEAKVNIPENYVVYCWYCGDSIPREIGSSGYYKRRKFCTIGCYNLFVKRPNGQKAIEASKEKSPHNYFSVAQKVVLKYIQKFGELDNTKLNAGQKHTLRSLEKKGLITCINNYWIFTKKGKEIKHGKIRKATPELFERIRNLPLRK